MADKTVTVKSSGGNYTSLNAALAGESANLVTGTCVLTIECYSMQDTTAASTGTGYTTSISYYVNITTPATERHAGVWNTAKYYLYVSNNSPLSARVSFIKITGLQLGKSSTNADYQYIIKVEGIATGSNDISIDKCIIKQVGNASYKEPGIWVGDADAIVSISNCAVYGSGAAVSSANSAIYISLATTVNVYNCTISGGYKGVYREAGTVSAYNTYAGNTGNADWNGTITKVNCGSEDGTADGTSPVTAAYSASTGAKFTNITAGSEDFHLQAGSSLIDAGNGAGMSFSDDIDGVTRTGTWDIGADEYVAAGGGSPSALAAIINHYRQLGVM